MDIPIMRYGIQAGRREQPECRVYRQRRAAIAPTLQETPSQKKVPHIVINWVNYDRKVSLVNIF